MELTKHPAFTVLILEDDPDGEAILDIAEEWYTQGVLDGFAVVTPGWVNTEGPGPATVSTHLVGGNEPSDLMTFLGSRPLGLVRLVVLNLLSHEDASSDLLVRACDEVATLIKRAMPLAIDENGLTTGVRLLRVNLMVPESNVALQRRELIQPGWEINAVVSPEDRPDLDRMNVFVRSGVNLAGHALGAAATVGGLWSGMGKAAFDELEVDSSYGGHEVRVIRCQAKLILGDDRVEQLASEAITRITGTQDGAVRFLQWGYETDRPDHLVTSTLGRLIELPEWKVEQREHDPLLRAEIPLGTVVRDWFRFQAALPPIAVGLLGGKAIDTFERGVTGALVGADAGVIGRIDPVTPEEAGKAAEMRLHELAASLAPLRLEEQASSWGQTSPGAWRRVRDLAMGLVDGSDLPDPFVRQYKAELVEVLAPSWVVAPPQQPAAPQSNHTTEAIGSPDSAADAQAPDRLLAEPEADADASRTLHTGDHVSSDDHEAVWVAGARPGLLDRLAAHVLAATDRETKAAQTASDDIAKYASAPSTKSLERARTLCFVGWIVAFVILGLVALGLWVTTNDGHAFTESKVWTRALSGVLLAAVVFLIGGHFYYRALRHYEWQVRQRMHALRIATDEYVAARQQQKRWNIMGRGLSDWMAILSELLHTPLSAQLGLESPSAPELRGVPAAVAVAVARERVDATHADLGRGAAEALCTQGWIRQEFARMLAASPSNNREAGAVSGDLPADLDLGLRQYGPRNELVRVASSDVVKKTATEAALRKIQHLAIEGRVQVPDLTVVRTGPYSSGQVEDHVGFFASTLPLRAPFAGEIFSEQAQVQGLQMPELRALSLPPGVKGRDDADTTIERSGLSLMTRVDVSATLRLDDVSLFVLRAKREQSTQPTSVDDFN
jgi:hypothetical protein